MGEKWQINSKWSESRKKHETGVATFLPLDNVNTSYQTECHQILSIDVACIKKSINFHKGKG